MRYILALALSVFTLFGLNASQQTYRTNYRDGEIFRIEGNFASRYHRILLLDDGSLWSVDYAYSNPLNRLTWTDNQSYWQIGDEIEIARSKNGNYPIKLINYTANDCVNAQIKRPMLQANINVNHSNSFFWGDRTIHFENGEGWVINNYYETWTNVLCIHDAQKSWQYGDRIVMVETDSCGWLGHFRPVIVINLDKGNAVEAESIAVNNLRTTRRTESKVDQLLRKN